MRRYNSPSYLAFHNSRFSVEVAYDYPLFRSLLKEIIEFQPLWLSTRLALVMRQ